MHPARTWDQLRPSHRALATEFLRFGVVGALGFLVDTAVLYAAIAAGAGLYWGRAFSYVAAATSNWALHRVWTFRSSSRERAGRQLLMFLLTNLAGFAVNYSTYALLVANLPVVAAHPFLGVAAGSIAGLVGNFVLSRRFVFGVR